MKKRFMIAYGISMLLSSVTYAQQGGLANPPSMFYIKNLRTNISIAQLQSNGVKVDYLLREFPNKHDQVGQAQFVATLPKGTVLNEGGILTEEGYILTDIQTTLGDQHRLKKEDRNLNNENPMFFKGKLAVIASAGSENWYHWLLQVLPRLIILITSNVAYDRLYINNLTYAWQKKALDSVLDYLHIPKGKLLIINGDSVIQAETLIVPSVPFIPLKIDGYLPSWMKNKLREIFLPKEASEKEDEKIYISRKNASMRRITNEEALTNKLRQFGFKILHLENIAPQEQAKIFNRAKVIVGPHGSGFANLLFTTPGYKIIEIDHGLDGAQRSFFKQFAKLTQGNYFPFYVDKTTEAHLEDDMTIDIGKFIAFLRGKESL